MDFIKAARFHLSLQFVTSQVSRRCLCHFIGMPTDFLWGHILLGGMEMRQLYFGLLPSLNPLGHGLSAYHQYQHDIGDNLDRRSED
jgi:hypothetical protein